MSDYLFTFVNGLARGLLLFTMAAGLSLLFGVMRVLNLAHGAIVLAGGYVAVTLTARATGMGLIEALPIALVVGALIGTALYFAVKPLLHRDHLDQGLLTLGFAFIFADIAELFWGTQVYSPPPPDFLNRSIELLGGSYPLYRLVVVGVGIVIAVAIFVVFERTRLGAILRAAVSDREMVAAVGFRVPLIMGGVFAGASALAALGGVIGAPIVGVRLGLDTETLILALVVIVIGGLGSLKGALIGALLVGQVQTLGILLLPQASAFLLFGVMAIVLIFKPAGLFGETVK
ncbi:MAG: Branched-chain amino acid transport system permease protein [Rhodoglobus sp.]|nr:Branched-chain amino acid transport system permease protein [Rhodoglobus sp.]